MTDEPNARVLVADDDARQLKALCGLLEEYGHETHGVRDGEAALEALASDKFDVVLVDLMMPGIDGIALVRAAAKVAPTVACVVVTGFGAIETAVEAMQAGALDYVIKPTRASVVLPAVERALAVRRRRVDNAALARRVHEGAVQLDAANADLAFARSVARDLRAPLRQVTACIAVLDDADAPALAPEARELVRKAGVGAARIEGLVDGLIRFARVGRRPLSRRPIDLASIVYDVLLEARESAGRRSFEIRVGALPGVVGDPSLVREAVAELLGNAMKFTRGRDPAVVEVGCRDEDGGRVFHVKDNGVGFDMRHVDRLFRPLQRLHEDDAFDGVGIGLAIVRRIVARHGGRVWAEAAPGEGATFRLTLPS